MKNKKIISTIIASSVVISGIALAIDTKEASSISADPYLRGADSTTIDSYPAEIQMYYYIKKFSAVYDIPVDYAFSVAYIETRYQGPKDSTYNPALGSPAGALGPMQVMPETAKRIYGSKVSTKRLRSDIPLNVEISMKLLRRLHNKYKNWSLVFGAYNTGKPCINSYAKKVIRKHYTWI